MHKEIKQIIYEPMHCTYVFNRFIYTCKSDQCQFCYIWPQTILFGSLHLHAMVKDHHLQDHPVVMWEHPCLLYYCISQNAHTETYLIQALRKTNAWCQCLWDHRAEKSHSISDLWQKNTSRSPTASLACCRCLWMM